MGAEWEIEVQHSVSGDAVRCWRELGLLGVWMCNSEVPQARSSELNIPPRHLLCLYLVASSHLSFPLSGVLWGSWWIFFSIEQSTLKMALQSTILSRKPGNLENLCQAKIFWNHFRDPIILEGCYELSQLPHQSDLKYIIRQDCVWPALTLPTSR